MENLHGMRRGKSRWFLIQLTELIEPDDVPPEDGQAYSEFYGAETSEEVRALGRRLLEGFRALDPSETCVDPVGNRGVSLKRRHHMVAHVQLKRNWVYLRYAGWRESEQVRDEADLERVLGELRRRFDRLEI